MTPFEVVRVAHILATTHETPWLVEGLWGQQAVGFIAGTPKSCKTWLSLELAVAVASGQPCLGRYPVVEPGPVLLYAAEDTAEAVRRRISGIAEARGVDLDRLAVGLITEPKLRLDSQADRQRLHATVAKIRPRLLVLDPLVRLHQGDENSSADVSRMLGALRQLQREHSVAIALVHHVRKGGATEPGQALRGSGDLHAWADSCLFLLRRRGRLELHGEHRAHQAPKPVRVELHSAPMHLSVIDGDPPPSGDSPKNADGDGTAPDVRLLAAAVVATLQHQPMTRTALRECLGVRNARLGWALHALGEKVQRVDGRLTVPRSHSPGT